MTNRNTMHIGMNLYKVKYKLEGTNTEFSRLIVANNTFEVRREVDSYNSGYR